MTRLDRLFQLLSGGSNALIRSHASEQLAALCRHQPMQLRCILQRLLPYIRSSNWSTRVAAAETIRLLSKHIDEEMNKLETDQETATPSVASSSSAPAASSSSSSSSSSTSSSTAPLLSLSTFSATSVISRGTLMLASSGDEYSASFSSKLASLALSDRIKSLRRQLLKRLGCYEEYVGTDAEMIVGEEEAKNVEEEMKMDSSSATAAAAAPTSGRERAKARRSAKTHEKRKREADSSLMNNTLDQVASESENKKSKVRSSNSVSISADSLLTTPSFDDDDSSDVSTSYILSDGSHILTPFLSRMLWSLLDVQWEVRHGAALAIRSVLMYHTARIGCDLRNRGAASSSSTPSSSSSHQSFLSDTCSRILCVLILDRFGDYSSERASFPVREAAAQILALLASELDRELLMLLVKNLLQISTHQNQELRYAGFLGLKYVIAVRFSSSESADSKENDIDLDLLHAVMNPLIASIQDSSDDVRGMVADSLLVVIHAISQSSKLNELISVNGLLSGLWSSLLLCDDLTTSTTQILELLHTTYNWITSNEQLSNSVQHLALSASLQRLFPFLSHSLVSVKINTWRTILTLTKIEFGRTSSITTSILPTLTTAMRLAYQSLVIESDQSLLGVCLDVVAFLSDTSIMVLDDAQYCTLFQSLITLFREFLFAPLFQPLPARLFMRVEYLQNGANANNGSTAHQSLGSAPMGSAHLVSSLDIKLHLSRALGMIYHRLATTTTTSTPASHAAVESHFRQLLIDLSSSSDLFVQMGCLTLCEWWTLAASNPHSLAASSPDWYNTLRRLVDPSTTGICTRSPNTKSLQAQTLIQICELGSSCSNVTLEHQRSSLLLCIDPLVYTLQMETNFEPLQQRCAIYLARLLIRLHNETVVKLEPNIISQGPTPVNEVVERLMNMLCSTLLVTAPIALTPHIPGKIEPLVKMKVESKEEELPASNEALMAMLLDDDDDEMGDATPSSASAPTKPLVDSSTAERGARLFLGALCQHCAAQKRDVLEVFPLIWTQHCLAGLHTPITHHAYEYNIACSLHSLRHLIPHLSPSEAHTSRVLTLLPSLHQLLLSTDPDPLIGELVRKLLLTMTQHYLTMCMGAFIRDILPVLSSTTSSSTSKIAILLLLQAMFTDLAVQLIPYLPFLIVPVLACMSDSGGAVSDDVASSSSNVLSSQLSCQRIRSLASSLFSTLMTYIPLEQGIPSPSDMSVELQQQRIQQRVFLQQLLDGKKVDDVILPAGLLHSDISLRSYQLEGIKWLCFLHRFHLHGILCDEMGVGKTSQVLVAMAMNLYERRKNYAKTALSSAASSSFSTQQYSPLPSLIICPSTLLYHWQYECKKFINHEICPIEIVVYQGSTKEKEAIRKRWITMTNASSPTSRDAILITSYESLRKDVTFFSSITWYHLTLDEGHIIKNPASQLYRALLTLRSHSRLILTGTPISNHILEVHSLFHFLMPGYLGTERDFKSQYAAPIQKARKYEVEKSGAKKKHANGAEEKDNKLQSLTSAGNIALESLHRRVLPFLLRRLKSDVLKELPPKIMQDYYVELSPIQKELYEIIGEEEKKLEDESEKIVGIGIDPASSASSSSSSSSSKSVSPTMHAFQALQYLRKLCSHPALVFTEAHPKYREIQKKYFSGSTATSSSSAASSCDTINSLHHAPKLVALQQLLLECGIGVVTSKNDSSDGADEEKTNKSQTKKKVVSTKKKSKATVDSEEEDDASLAISSSRHRVLIFAQLKATLDLVERDVFNSGSTTNSDGFLPGSVSFLRLDGSTPTTKRFELVQQFNSDPSIDCMLLTTSVGGLGLNLSSAETVIFLEHDFNPQRDLQAMDRVHRLGQRASVVNIYRIICRDTLEERTMGIQRFKMHVANSVINTENASMSSMDTGNTLERFENAAASAMSKEKKQQKKKKDIMQTSLIAFTSSGIPSNMLDFDDSTTATNNDLDDTDSSTALNDFLASYRRR